LEEVVKYRKPFCPQCGKKRGVFLIRNRHVDGTEHYICCENCAQRWLIVNFGVWGGLPIKLEE